VSTALQPAGCSDAFDGSEQTVMAGGLPVALAFPPRAAQGIVIQEATVNVCAKAARVEGMPR